MVRSVRVGWIIAVVYLCCAAPAPAQSVLQVSGVIRDSTGAVLPAVAVMVSGDQPTTSQTTFSDSEGRYRIALSTPGRYRLSATLPGFEPYTTHIGLIAPVVHDIVLIVPGVAERVMVTALRMGETDSNAAPAALSVLSGSAMERMSISSLGGLVGLVPGLMLSESPGGRVLATIRGIGTNTGVVGSDPSSTIYLDGVYLARAAAATADFLDVERVEVLRGPQGSLYGRNSVGGAINIVTRAPTDTLSADARLSVGADRLLRAEAAVRGPLRRGWLTASAAVLRGVRDGFVSDLGHPDRPLGGDDTWMARAQLRAVMAMRGELLLAADYGQFEGLPLPFAKPVSVRPGFAIDNPESPWSIRTNAPTSAKNLQAGVSARVKWQLRPSLTLTSLSALRRSRDRVVLDRDSTELPIIITDVPDHQRQLSEELTLTSRGRQWSWIAGTFLFDENDTAPVRVTLERPALQLRPSSTIDTSSRAVFGQAVYTV
jgi:iron complex outermembrane recepter protein